MGPLAAGMVVIDAAGEESNRLSTELRLFSFWGGFDCAPKDSKSDNNEFCCGFSALGAAPDESPKKSKSFASLEGCLSETGAAVGADDDEKGSNASYFCEWDTGGT
jgi:hypothetical protein